MYESNNIASELTKQKLKGNKVELKGKIEKPQSRLWEIFYAPLSATDKSSRKIPGKDTEDLNKMINTLELINGYRI